MMIYVTCNCNKYDHILTSRSIDHELRGELYKIKYLYTLDEKGI